MKITAKQAMTKALEAESEGEFETAIKIYRSIIKKLPDHKSARDKLAKLQEKYHNQNSEKSPRLAPTKEELGIVEGLIAQGKLERAAKLCKQLILKFPESDTLYGILGSVRFRQAKNQLALKSYDKALLLNPLDAISHLNKSLVLESLGRIDESLESINEGIGLNPVIPKAYLQRAGLYSKKSKYREAFEDYDHALSIDSKFVEAHNNKGALYSDLGRMREALSSYDKAIQIEPGSAHIHYNKALANASLGHFDEAIKGHEKALELDPTHGQAYHSLSNLTSLKPTNPLVANSLNLIADANTSNDSKVPFLFALGKIYEDAGDYDASFSYLEKGNLNKNTLLSFNFQNYVHTFKRIKHVYSEIKSRELNSHRLTNSSRPIFIVGMPRSGTSLVEQILASHQEVYGAGELRFIGELMGKILEPYSHQKKQINNDFPLVKALESFGCGYYEKVASLGITSPVFTDKMPHNFRFIGFILKAIPEARVIHCKRQPVATCWSIFKTLFGHTGNSFAYDLNSLGNYYKLYEDLMAFWHREFPGKIYDLSYEGLTENQKDESRRLLDFCGLEWQEECMQFHKTKRAVKTASLNQVRKKLYQGSSDEWKRYERHLRPLIKILEGGNASESSK